MAAFERRYSDREREALASAYVDRGIRPAAKVAQLAEAGELEPDLPAFKVPGGKATVLGFAKRLRDARAGKVRSETAKLPPGDALEVMRRRLLAAADYELACIEHAQAEDRKKARGKREGTDPDRIRQVARMVREVASIPAEQAQGGKGKPTRTETGKQALGAGHPQRVGGIGGDIIRDVERGPQSEPHQTHPADNGESDASTLSTVGSGEREDEAPGAWARRALAPSSAA